MSNGGLNEGFADVWAISLTENPVLGYGWDLLDPTILLEDMIKIEKYISRFSWRGACRW